MRFFAYAASVAVLALAFSVQPAAASDHSRFGCISCKVGHVHQWLSSATGHGQRCCWDGNCLFSPCGKPCAPGPWYTYWPNGAGSLTSSGYWPYWSYRDHWQMPAPIGASAWYTPDYYQGGSYGTPMYWFGH